jgi:hypothetical protein
MRGFFEFLLFAAIALAIMIVHYSLQSGIQVSTIIANILNGL